MFSMKGSMLSNYGESYIMYLFDVLRLRPSPAIAGLRASLSMTYLNTSLYCGSDHTPFKMPALARTPTFSLSSPHAADCIRKVRSPHRSFRCWDKRHP